MKDTKSIEIIIPNDTKLESGMTLGELLKIIEAEEYEEGVADACNGTQRDVSDRTGAYNDGYSAGIRLKQRYP